jgi:hypothetical protein
MDPDLKDRLLNDPRARELAELQARQRGDVPPEEIRAQLGCSGASDEEFLLRYIMQGGQEIETMRAAGPYKRYFESSQPLITLVRELEKCRRVRYVHVRRGCDSLLMQRQTTLQGGVP